MYEFNGCKQQYQEKWVAANVDGTLSQKDWDAWFAAHCAKCPAMSEICMADEMTTSAK